jgi:diketogulonate reductase-like aldo/keto reductase
MTAHGIVTQSWTPLGQGHSFAAPSRSRPPPRRCGSTPAQVILRWHIQIGAAVIPRSTREAGLRENLALFDFALTEDGDGRHRHAGRRRPLRPRSGNLPGRLTRAAAASLGAVRPGFPSLRPRPAG